MMNDYQLKQILIFGEVLVDKFDNGIQKIGGAPFNTAIHLQNFGCDPLFVSSVGNDPDGKNIISLAKKNKLNTSLLLFNESKPTGTAKIISSKKEPDFVISADSAYDFINHAPVLNKLTDKYIDIIYHGTLALRKKNNLELLEKIIKLKKPLIFFDVNLRHPWWDTNVLKKFLVYSNFVKMNFNELKIISKKFNIDNKDFFLSAKKLKDLFDIDFLYVTNGEQGGFVLRNNQLVHYEARKTKHFANSVGAGDAFCSVLLLGIIRKWKLTETLKAASEFSSHVCEQNGTIPNDYNIYDNLRKKWLKNFR